MTEPIDFDRYGSIRERDIDLIVCIAAAAIPRVWRLFAEVEDRPRTSHSVSTPTGEIDVMLEWPARSVHIENKVDALFQPTQAERYRARAEAAGHPTLTVLLAPASYIETHSRERQAFDAAVSYEQLAEVLDAESSRVGSELALVVRHAIEQHRRGRVGEVSDARTEFFREFAVLSADRGLPFVVTGDRGPRSGFFYAHSWDDVAGRKVELVAKFDHHQTVDVQIDDAAHVAEGLAATLAADGVTARSTGVGTLILGRWAPSLDPDSPAAAQQEALDAFMDVAAAHQEWWMRSGKQSVVTAIARHRIG